ncbi:MAG: TetR/AcrR family transcriptional regulator [Jatrophihabitantaceae bacterium]
MTGTRLTPQHWVDAALKALLTDGPDAVAIQPLARTIGTSKGSFYWHFATRDDLLRAALERWLQVSTEDVITMVEARSDDPRGRARVLFEHVIHSSTVHPGQLALLAASNHPDVRDALDRATRRRIQYVAGLLRAAGFPAAVATRRATIAYATYLGHAQLAHSTPDALPRSAAGRRRLLDELTGLVLG